MVNYEYLSKEQREFFVEHGWLRIPNAIDPKYLKEWMEDFWVRLGWDENDKSTWDKVYLKMPRHREVETYKFCPDAWKAMCEIVGGEENIDPVRESYYGDQFIVNAGSEELKTQPDKPPQELFGWHTDNDYFRHFLDSSSNALTIIHCITDIPEGGGGTWVCEDGIKGICEYLYRHPEGIDPPMNYMYKHMPECEKFAQVVAKAGDVFITHALLPHTAGVNHKHYARIITNPHVNLHSPYNFNRPKGEDYTLCEQVILRALGRESIPEFKITRPREMYYPRTAGFKRGKADQEVARMIAAAKAKGLGPESVNSIYLKGPEAMAEHEKLNGYDRPYGPAGIQIEEKADPQGNEYWMAQEALKGNTLDLMRQLKKEAKEKEEQDKEKASATVNPLTTVRAIVAV